MKKYRCIFFDLDHTLWDYEANARQTLHALFDQFKLANWNVPDKETLYHVFRDVNFLLWDKYDRSEIDVNYLRTHRFRMIMQRFNQSDMKLAEALSKEYLKQSPHGSHLLPNTMKTLEYLKQHYRLTIITNGFESIQHTKLRAGNLNRYFDHMVTSEAAGCRKPATAIFELALRLNQIDHHEAIMIGDNLITDIQGAKNANIDTVFFNPESIQHNVQVKHEIKGLIELCQLL